MTVVAPEVVTIEDKHFSLVSSETDRETALNLCIQLEDMHQRPSIRMLGPAYQVLRKFTRAEEIEFLLDQQCRVCLRNSVANITIPHCKSCKTSFYRSSLKFHEQCRHTHYMLRLLELLSAS